MNSQIEQFLEKAITTKNNLEANEYLRSAMNLVYNEKIIILNKINCIALSRRLPT